MELVTVDKFAIELTHLCNLSCEGCNHFSNFRLPGQISVPFLAEQFQTWNKKILPASVRLMGGEPTIHPDLVDCLRVAAECWPQSHIVLFSNGYFLDRHPGLLDALLKHKVHFVLTLHSSQKDYQNKMRLVTGVLDDWAGQGANVFYFDAMTREIRGSSDHRQGVTFWYQHYRSTSAGIKPFSEGNPRESWKQCGIKDCLMMRDNQLWKCPPLCNMSLLAKKLGLEKDPDWMPYLHPESLRSESTPSEVRAWLGREDVPECAMCPVAPSRMTEKSI